MMKFVKPGFLVAVLVQSVGGSAYAWPNISLPVPHINISVPVPIPIPIPAPIPVVISSAPSGVVTPNVPVPPPVNNAVNAVKKAGDDVANTVAKAGSDTAKAVGKAGGDIISTVGKAGKDIIAEAGRVYDHNVQTFTTLGRASACAFTMCASEAYYAVELKKSRDEADQEIGQFKAKELAAYRAKQMDEYYSQMRQEYVFLSNKDKNLIASLTIAQNSVQLSVEVQSALDAEIKLRQEFQALGEAVPPAQGVTLDAVKQLQTAIANGKLDQTSMTQFGETLAGLSKTKGQQLGTLVAEALRNMDSNTLGKLSSYEATQRASTKNYMGKLQEDRNETESRMKVIESAFASANQRLI